MRLDGGHKSPQDNYPGEYMFHHGQGSSLHGKLITEVMILSINGTLTLKGLKYSDYKGTMYV